MIESAVRVLPFGDAAVFVELEQRVDEGIVSRARAIADAWESEGLGSAVPAYASVLLRFDPLTLPPEAAATRARMITELRREGIAPSSERLIEVPTRYGGPDLAEVAALSGLTPDQLIELHAGREYTAFFLGFMPGLAYCGTLDSRIQAPRLASPRARVPAGSVAIADGQTTVYPLDSPGGWRLIGRTELRMFDAARTPAVLVAAGDRLRFVPR
ncbi:MAG: 5-oxoprolinase subunit PxpB [Chloroflexota bacterium]|nr:5-oxoprolinase subunit PxpB [Chloroflexota bacterium]